MDRCVHNSDLVSVNRISTALVVVLPFFLNQTTSSKFDKGMSDNCLYSLLGKYACNNSARRLVWTL